MKYNNLDEAQANKLIQEMEKNKKIIKELW